MQHALQECGLSSLLRRPKETGTCQRHGEYKAVPSPTGKLYCPQCDMEKKRQQRLADITRAEQERQRRKAARIEKEQTDLIGRSAMPKTLVNKSIAQYQCYDQRQQEIIAKITEFGKTNIEQNLEKGLGLLMIGSSGVGKGHLACAVGNYVLRKLKKSVLYITHTEFELNLAKFRKSKVDNEIEFINSLGEVELLIFDELLLAQISGGDYTAHKQQLLELLIDIRYRNGKSTIYCTNAGFEKMAIYLNAQALERIQERNTPLVMQWESYRKRTGGVLV